MVQMLITRRETREEECVDNIQPQKRKSAERKEECSSSHKREPRLDASRVKRCFKPPRTDIHVAI